MKQLSSLQVSTFFHYSSWSKLSEKKKCRHTLRIGVGHCSKELKQVCFLRDLGRLLVCEHITSVQLVLNLVHACLQQRMVYAPMLWACMVVVMLVSMCPCLWPCVLTCVGMHGHTHMSLTCIVVDMHGCVHMFVGTHVCLFNCTSRCI